MEETRSPRVCGHSVGVNADNFGSRRSWVRGRWGFGGERVGQLPWEMKCLSVVLIFFFSLFWLPVMLHLPTLFVKSSKRIGGKQFEFGKELFILRMKRRG